VELLRFVDQYTKQHPPAPEQAGNGQSPPLPRASDDPA
jgi:hypothetical protein